MKNKGNSDVTPAMRRKSIAEDVAAFLKAGNKIAKIPTGVSGQDPQGSRSKQLRLSKSSEAKK